MGIELGFFDSIDSIKQQMGISKERLIEIVKDSIIAAYRKNYNPDDQITVDINEDNGEVSILLFKDVVEEVENANAQISLKDAREQIDPRYEVGDIITYQISPKNFGRIAAQDAKQNMIQKIKEEHKENIYNEYKVREGELITGTVEKESRNRQGRINYFVNIGSGEGMLSNRDQIRGESFRIGSSVRAVISEVRKTSKDVQIVLSRTTPAFLEGIFQLEVPEIEDGIVEIVSVARDAGSRSKVAVVSHDEEVDPIGACLGGGFIRIQHISDELHGEKIDLVEYRENPEEYIINALKPAKVLKVIFDEDDLSALVVVDDNQLSLAIGRSGQNVRLAAKVTGYKIDIKSLSDFEAMYGESDYERAQEDVIALIGDSNEGHMLDDATVRNSEEEDDAMTNDNKEMNVYDKHELDEKVDVDAELAKDSYVAQEKSGTAKAAREMASHGAENRELTIEEKVQAEYIDGEDTYLKDEGPAHEATATYVENQGCDRDFVAYDENEKPQCINEDELLAHESFKEQGNVQVAKNMEKLVADDEEKGKSLEDAVYDEYADKDNK